jgi:hypothetical protein
MLACVSSIASCIVPFGKFRLLIKTECTEQKWGFSRLQLFHSLSKLQHTVRTPCMHRFCRECLEHALKIKRVCPLCNKPVTTNRAIMPSHLFDDLTKTYEMIKKAYERDTGNELSSQEYDHDLRFEPNQDLSQLFPYPEKDELVFHK